SRSGDANEGRAILDGFLCAPCETLAHHRPHGSTHEFELKACQDDRHSLNGTAHHDHGFAFAGLLDRLGYTLRILAAVLELERVRGARVLTDFHPAFGIEQCLNTRPCPNTHMVAAFRADVQRGLQVFLVQHGFARWAFDPNAFWNAPPPIVATIDARGQNFFDPTHGLFPMNAQFPTGLLFFYRRRNDPLHACFQSIIRCYARLDG